MSVISAAQRMLARRGETMILARESEGTTVTLKGKRLGGGLDDAGNTAVQQAFSVLIGTTELLASAWSSKVPTADADDITIGGRRRRILDVQPRLDGDTVGLYELVVAG